MKAKKTAPPRRRISFAVDRDEIEINSDWVDAVMASPAATAPNPPPAIVVSFPAPADSDLFFGPGINSATGAKTATDETSSTGEECTSVEESSAVVKIAPVAELLNQVVAHKEDNINGQPVTLANNATVEDKSTGVFSSTGERVSSAKDHRVPRPRPLVRITDGLTPGQYAVYSLMFEAGESTGGLSRTYKGGYADLGRLTGLSKRGIQNIVAELQAKEVISIHQQPGYHRTETSAYLVPDPAAVLQLWSSKGWRRALGKSKTLIN
jgi:hypothetical protein